MGAAGLLWHYYDLGIRNSDIMRPRQYSTATLIDLFHRQTVASLPEVMAALGTRARRTAFRKLKELPYRTSYSYRGGYYTLEELIDFDQHGLWSFRAVRFSAAGTLLATAAALVSDAPAGQFSEELDNLLHVGTQDALRKLVQQRKLSRQKVAGQFLYCAADRTRKAQQLSARRALLAAPGLVGPVPDADLMPDQLRAAIVLFASLLDERQRRLYAGLESLKCGWGGDARIAGLLGIDPGTVARGRKQLLASACAAPAAGARPWKKTPEVIAAIEAALQHDVAGDPITGIRWTRRTTEKIATELATLDIQVCPRMPSSAQCASTPCPNATCLIFRHLPLGSFHIAPWWTGALVSVMRPPCTGHDRRRGRAPCCASRQGNQGDRSALTGRDFRIRPPSNAGRLPPPWFPPTARSYSPEARFSSATSAFSSATSACSVRRSVA